MAGWKRRLAPGATDPDGGVDRELDEEIRTHLDLRTEELVAGGMPEDEARAEALRRFGAGPDARRRLADEARRQRRRKERRGAFDEAAADVRIALRQARRSPGFTAVAVLIFAAGVGLATSMFTVADHVLLRPLPFPEPDRLVALWSVAEDGGDFPWVSMSNWVDWKDGTAHLEHTAIHARSRASVATADGAFHASAAEVGGSFFSTLRLPFTLGRGFTEDEAQADAPLAVVSTGFWSRVLGAPTDLSTVEITVDGVRRRVVGVTPTASAFPAGTEVWVPERYRAGGGGLRNNINYEAVARLRPGATLAAARAELDAVARGIRESDPVALYSWGVGVHPLKDVLTRNARSYIVMLAAAVGFLLLVACANLAGLSLARSRRRAQETAVHLALGAGRGRLVRRVVTEHVVLALVGGTLGVVLAWLATDLLMSRVGAVVPRAAEVAFDLRVAAFGVAAALAAGLVAGLAPALRGSRGDLSTVLSGSRGGITGGRGLPGATMVGAEVALAVTLLVAGGLLLRSFQTVVGQDLGFDPTGVVTADVALVGGEYADTERRTTFWSTVRAQLTELPGVETAAAADHIPTTDGGRGFIDLVGREGEDIGAGYWVVSEGYFEALDIPLLRGRAFDASDDVGTERVAVINRAMAQEFWPDADPLGQRVRARSMERPFMFGTPETPWITVVGVVEDTRQYGFESDPEADMFVLDRQVPYHTGVMTLVVEARGDAAGIAEAIRSTVAGVDPSVAVETSSLEGRLAATTAERRMVLSGLGLFGGAAVLLVCLGIYGLMSFAAEARTREMAVRAALGAERGGLVGLMLGGALRVVAIGGVVGLFGAWAFTRLVESFLVGIEATDPVTYAGAVALLMVVALLAALVPSVRAARQDPLEALRAEG